MIKNVHEDQIFNKESYKFEISLINSLFKKNNLSEERILILITIIDVVSNKISNIFDIMKVSFLKIILVYAEINF